LSAERLDPADALTQALVVQELGCVAVFVEGVVTLDFAADTGLEGIGAAVGARRGKRSEGISGWGVETASWPSTEIVPVTHLPWERSRVLLRMPARREILPPVLEISAARTWRISARTQAKATRQAGIASSYCQRGGRIRPQLAVTKQIPACGLPVVVPPCPERPPATLCQPCGLGSANGLSSVCGSGVLRPYSHRTDTAKVLWLRALRNPTLPQRLPASRDSTVLPRCTHHVHTMYTPCGS